MLSCWLQTCTQCPAGPTTRAGVRMHTLELRAVHLTLASQGLRWWTRRQAPARRCALPVQRPTCSPSTTRYSCPTRWPSSKLSEAVSCCLAQLVHTTNDRRDALLTCFCVLPRRQVMLMIVSGDPHNGGGHASGSECLASTLHRLLPIPGSHFPRRYQCSPQLVLPLAACWPRPAWPALAPAPGALRRPGGCHPTRSPTTP